MNSKMLNRDQNQGVKFFTGTEVEHTPAYNKQTLFVVGLQSVTEIQDWLDDLAGYEDQSRRIEHIYFGANMSFPVSIRTNDSVFWTPWENMIKRFLLQGYQCTLDIDVSQVEGLLESGLCENHMFIPMISVKIPYIQQLGYNATVKIDDKGFAATNPGVWCHSLHTLQNRSVFTDWSKYTKDTEL
jgi:hypothetical protein